MRFQEDLSVFFFDFGELVTLHFADGTTRAATAIFDCPSIEAQDGTLVLDTHAPVITLRSVDATGLHWKTDWVTRAGDGTLYDVTRTPEDDGTGLTKVQLAQRENF